LFVAVWSAAIWFVSAGPLTLVDLLSTLEREGVKGSAWLVDIHSPPGSRGSRYATVIVRTADSEVREWSKVPLHSLRWSDFKPGHPPFRVEVRYLPHVTDVPPVVADEISGMRKSAWGGMIFGWFLSSFAVLMLFAKAAKTSGRKQVGSGMKRVPK